MFQSPFVALTAMLTTLLAVPVAPPRQAEPTFVYAEDPLHAQKQFGIYLNGGSAANDQLMDKVIKQLPRRGVSTVVVDVKDHYIYVSAPEGSIADRYRLALSLYDLKELVQAAHSEGLYVIARYVAVKDKQMGDIISGTRIRHPITDEELPTEWVDPSNETVLEYNKELLATVAASGVDEINLDYIRYPSDNLLALNSVSTEQKVRNLEEYIRMARDTIDATASGTKLGISTFAILGWQYEENVRTIAQDVVRFAPLVDVISPMAYPQTFSVAGGYYNPSIHPRSRNYWLVYRTLQGYKELLGDEHSWKLRPWIQMYFMEPADMLDQMDAVYDSGLCGFTVWSQGNYYTSFYEALSQWSGPPERCIDTSGEVEVLE